MLFVRVSYLTAFCLLLFQRIFIIYFVAVASTVLGATMPSRNAEKRTLAAPRTPVAAYTLRPASLAAHDASSYDKGAYQATASKLQRSSAARNQTQLCLFGKQCEQWI